MQIVSIGDNWHAVLNPVSWKNKKNVSKCHLLNFFTKTVLSWFSWNFHITCWLKKESGNCFCMYIIMWH